MGLKGLEMRRRQGEEGCRWGVAFWWFGVGGGEQWWKALVVKEKRRRKEVGTRRESIKTKWVSGREEGSSGQAGKTCLFFISTLVFLFVNYLLLVLLDYIVIENRCFDFFY
jgi:hypothetical protein